MCPRCLPGTCTHEVATVRGGRTSGVWSRATGTCTYAAFDALWVNGKDLRGQSLTKRKRALSTRVRTGPRQAATPNPRSPIVRAVAEFPPMPSSTCLRLSWRVSQFQVIALPSNGPVRGLEPDIERLRGLRGPQIVPHAWYQLRLGACPTRP